MGRFKNDAHQVGEEGRLQKCDSACIKYWKSVMVGGGWSVV